MQADAAPIRASSSVLARCLGFLRLLHPFPSLLNALVVVGLACLATRGWPGGDRLIALAITMLTIQCAIGALNDWADRDLDALAKPQKPIAAGLVPARAALSVAGALALAGALLAARFGIDAWLLAMAGLTIGLAYDLGLKRTPLSALTYALALPLIPVWVWTALGEGSRALVIVLPVAALLGFGLQLANALPDATGDAAGGVRGTLQWLGLEWGRRVAWLSVGGALLIAGVAAPLAELSLWPFAACWVAAALLLAGAVLLYRRRPSARSLQLGWSLLAPAAGLLALGWLGSLP